MYLCTRFNSNGKALDGQVSYDQLPLNPQDGNVARAEGCSGAIGIRLVHPASLAQLARARDL